MNWLLFVYLYEEHCGYSFKKNSLDKEISLILKVDIEFRLIIRHETTLDTKKHKRRIEFIESDRN